MTDEQDVLLDETFAGVLARAAGAGGGESRARALAAMAEARAAAPPRRWRAVTTKSVIAAAAVVALLLAPVIWRISAGGKRFAPGKVAQAMEGVQSAHLVGWQLDPTTGQHRTVEGWVKGGSKLRLRTEGGEEVFDNGERMVTIQWSDQPPTVTLKPREKLPGMSAGMSYLDLFSYPGILTSTMRGGRAELVSSQMETLPDGRKVWTAEFDAEPDGRLTMIRVEYNVDIPDSVFEAAIPRGAIVIDAAEQRRAFASWEEQAQQLMAAGAQGCGTGGPGTTATYDSPFHHDLHFRPDRGSGLIVLYLPDRNVYRVFGRAFVWEGSASSPGRIVENAEFPAPSPPDKSVAQVEAEQNRFLPHPPPEWAAKAKELQALGAEHIAQLGGGTNQPSRYHPQLMLDALGDHDVDLWYQRDRNEYYVMGKARLYDQRHRFDQSVEDAWVRVPWPPEE